MAGQRFGLTNLMGQPSGEPSPFQSQPFEPSPLETWGLYSIPGASLPGMLGSGAHAREGTMSFFQPFAAKCDPRGASHPERIQKMSSCLGSHAYRLTKLDELFRHAGLPLLFNLCEMFVRAKSLHVHPNGRFRPHA